MSNVLETLGQSNADVLHRVIRNTFIVEMGIVKAIPSKGIVTVEMSVANSKNNITITNCVLASIASSAVTLDIQPEIDDKVIVLFPRRFAGNMFDCEVNETIVSDAVAGYSVSGGIAILLNQYRKASHNNLVQIEKGCLDVKLAYDKDSEENKLKFTTDEDGAVTLTSNNTNVTINKEDVITVNNGSAEIKIDNSGNVTVNAKGGKITVKNDSTNLKDVIDGLAKELENLITKGSPAMQATSPESKATIAVWRNGKLNQLLQ